MEPDVLHSLIPIFEEFSTITALTRPVTLHWKIPEFDGFDLILKTVLHVEMLAKVVPSSKCFPIFSGYHALQVMYSSIAKK
jgi:hypothetical protein